MVIELQPAHRHQLPKPEGADRVDKSIDRVNDQMVMQPTGDSYFFSCRLSTISAEGLAAVVGKPLQIGIRYTISR